MVDGVDKIIRCPSVHVHYVFRSDDLIKRDMAYATDICHTAIFEILCKGSAKQMQSKAKKQSFCFLNNFDIILFKKPGAISHLFRIFATKKQISVWMTAN